MLNVMAIIYAIKSMQKQSRSDASGKDQIPSHVINSTLWSSRRSIYVNPTHASIDLEGLRLDIATFL